MAWWLRQAQQINPIAIPTRYQHSFQFAYLEDLVWCLDRAIDCGAAKNQLFNVAMAETLTVQSWVDCLNVACGGNAKIHWVDDPAIELPLFNYTPYLFDINKAKNYLDFKPTPLDQWVQITTSWYQ